MERQWIASGSWRVGRPSGAGEIEALGAEEVARVAYWWTKAPLSRSQVRATQKGFGKEKKGRAPPVEVGIPSYAR